MKKNLICLLALMTVCVCQAEDINIHFDGATAKVKQNVMRRSASLVGSPAFKIGNSYTVKIKGYEKTFTFNEPFTIVR